MKILLLGGTGAMGVHLSDCLANSLENQIFITSRKPQKTEKANQHFILGDAHSHSFLQKLLSEQWDVIVDFMIYSTQEFQERAELFLSKTRQYIFLSSARVYADSTEPITENSPRLLDVIKDNKYLATDEYALAKARQENILFRSGQKNWTIIRPYITFNESRLQLGAMEKELWLERCLRDFPIVFSRDIAERTTTLTYGKDVARGIAAVCGVEKAYSEVFHITGNHSFTWQTVLEHYVKVLEKVKGHPVDVVMTDKALQLNTSGKYQVMYDRYYNRTFDNSKICKFMPGDSFSDSLTELEKCLEKFLKNPHFQPLGVSYNAKFDRICKTKMSLSELSNWKKKIKYFLCRYILPL